MSQPAPDGPGEHEVVVDEVPVIHLSIAELRQISGYAVACAEPALEIFERDCTDDRRPRAALEEARAFAAGGDRTKALRLAALAAHRAAQAARETGLSAAADAARAAAHAAASAYLHPLAKATQVKHILGSAAHAARAIELDAGDDPHAGAHYLMRTGALANPTVTSVLARFPNAPIGGGRVGELLRELDASLRQRPTER